LGRRIQWLPTERIITVGLALYLGLFSFSIAIYIIELLLCVARDKDRCKVLVLSHQGESGLVIPQIKE
jgi:hypothetical protein